MNNKRMIIGSYIRFRLDYGEIFIMNKTYDSFKKNTYGYFRKSGIHIIKQHVRSLVPIVMSVHYFGNNGLSKIIYSDGKLLLL